MIKALVSVNATSYAYGPFGEVIRATGPLAKLNPFRFFTKSDDDEADLLYYGYRYYNPTFRKWVSRDPVAETGFRANLTEVHKYRKSSTPPANLYLFVRNCPLVYIDPHGLYDTPGQKNMGKELEAQCKCDMSCIDKEDLKRIIENASSIIGQLSTLTYQNWGEFAAAAAKQGVVALGQTDGFIGTLTGASDKRSTGEQCIVKYFESIKFTSVEGSATHPLPIDSHGDGSEYTTQWILAEIERLSNAVKALHQAQTIEGCPVLPKPN